MADLNEMLIFAAVGSHGGFIAAARALGIPKATVSRKVQDLERRLGARLLQRTTRRMTLTEAGEAFLEYCARVQSEIENAEIAVSRMRAAPRGLLRVSAPFTLGNLLLLPALPEFLARYPDVSVALTMRNDFEDLIKQGVDVALTALPIPDSSYTAMLLGKARFKLYASPGYLARRGKPQAPRDLADHATLLFGPLTRPGHHVWILESGGRRFTAALRPVLICNDMTPLLRALHAGAGITMTSEALAQEDVSAGRLVPVLPDWSGPLIEARAVYASRKGLLPRVRVFLDFLAEKAAEFMASLSHRRGGM